MTPIVAVTEAAATAAFRLSVVTQRFEASCATCPFALRMRTQLVCTHSWRGRFYRWLGREVCPEHPALQDAVAR